MVGGILGRFFVNTGKMTQQQYETVLQKQEAARVKMGLIAVSEGFMSLEQADEINHLQAIMDKKFGDIAVEKGILSEAQVEAVLKMQGNEYLIFIQTIMDEEIADYEEIEAWLKEFKEENQFSKSGMEALKSGDIDKIIPLYLPYEASQYGEQISTVIRTMYRLIDRQVGIEKARIEKTATMPCSAIQRMDGESDIFTAFTDGDEGILVLAEKFAKECFADINEDVLDAAGEFLNCVNGLFASVMSGKGVELELLPPEFDMEEEEVFGGEFCMVPIFVKNRKLYFIISDKIGIQVGKV